MTSKARQQERAHASGTSEAAAGTDDEAVPAGRAARRRGAAADRADDAEAATDERSAGRSRSAGRTRSADTERPGKEAPAGGTGAADPGDDDPADDAGADRTPADRGARRRSRRRRPSLPLVPLLSALLALLVGLIGYLLVPVLWGPEESAIRTDTYAEVLSAARSNVVDLTSFDHLTLDDDIEQARRVTTGDLEEESVGQLQDQRQLFVDNQVVVSTEVVGAGVTRADEQSATVVMVILTTSQDATSQQAQASRYRIEVELTREDGRWLLSGITGR